MKEILEGLIDVARQMKELLNLIKEAEKTEADSGLVRFGDLEDWQFFTFSEDGPLMKIPASEGFNTLDMGRDFAGDQYTYEDHVLVRPIEVEIRKKVPGEVSVEIDADDACDIFDCYCTGRPLGDFGDKCPRCDYTWTLTATPKTKTKTKTTEEAN